MSALLKPMALDEFVAWEERQELRYEYDGIEARAMTGGTEIDSSLQSNLIIALGVALRGKPCRVHGSELKVRTATSIRYPDALIVCGPPKPKSTFTTDPVVIFEILSPSSARLDLGAKNVEYQSLASLARYVVLHQTQTAAEMFARDAEGEWTYAFLDASGVLDMPEAGIVVPLTDIYGDVAFS
jgi:Uma2 family endonuclease